MVELKSGITADKLLSRDRGGERIERRLAEIWAVELDLLIEFDRVCRLHGLKYFLHAGTLLGAMRHGGFIPWDDDIDVGMVREEYEKFLKVAPTAFSRPYEVVDPVRELDSFSWGHVTLRHSETTALATCNCRNGKTFCRFNQGIFLDVFPFDAVPDEEGERARFLQCVYRAQGHALRARRARAFASGFRFQEVFRHPVRARVRGWWQAFAARAFGIDLCGDAIRRADAFTASCNGIAPDAGARFASDIAFNSVHGVRFFDRKLFECPSVVEFEGIPFFAPSNPDAFLTAKFGDWHKPVRGTQYHEISVFDASRPWTDYAER